VWACGGRANVGRERKTPQNDSTPVEPRMVTWRWGGTGRYRRQGGRSGIFWEIDLLSSVILRMSSRTHGLGPKLTHKKPRKATKMERKITKSHEHHNHLKRVYEISLPAVSHPGKIKIQRNDHVPVGDWTHGLSRLTSRHALHQ